MCVLLTLFLSCFILFYILAIDKTEMPKTCKDKSAVRKIGNLNINFIITTQVSNM